MHVIQSRITLFFAAAVSFLIAFALLSRAAHGDDTPAPQTVSASAGNVSPALAPTLPDPLDEPLGFWDGIRDLRRTGGLWPAIALGLAVLMSALHKRAIPRPGEEEPPPTSWRARSIALLAGLGAVLGAGADMLLGLGNWAAFFTVIVSSASLIWRALNPPKGTVKSARSPVAPLSALLVLLMLSSCATARHAGAAGASAGLDCQAPSLQATLVEAAVLAKALVISKISGTGEVDADGLREAARALKSEGLRCALVGAIAAVADAMQGREQSIRPLFAPPPVDLRALGRSIAAEEWGLSGPLLVEGGAL